MDYNISKQYLASLARKKRRSNYASQSAAAAAIGLTQQDISRLEAGRLSLPMTAQYLEAMIEGEVRESRTRGGAYRVGRLK